MITPRARRPGPVTRKGLLPAARALAVVAAVALATSPPASASGPHGPASLFDYDRSASRERGWIKTKNPSSWRRDAKREAMQRSRERRQRTHV